MVWEVGLRDVFLGRVPMRAGERGCRNCVAVGVICGVVAKLRMECARVRVAVLCRRHTASSYSPWREAYRNTKIQTSLSDQHRKRSHITKHTYNKYQTTTLGHQFNTFREIGQTIVLKKSFSAHPQNLFSEQSILPETTPNHTMRGKIVEQLSNVCFSFAGPSSKRTKAPAELMESTLTAREDNVFSVLQIQTWAHAGKLHFR